MFKTKWLLLILLGFITRASVPFLASVVYEFKAEDIEAAEFEAVDCTGFNHL